MVNCTSCLKKIYFWQKIYYNFLEEKGYEYCKKCYEQIIKRNNESGGNKCMSCNELQEIEVLKQCKKCISFFCEKHSQIHKCGYNGSDLEEIKREEFKTLKNNSKKQGICSFCKKNLVILEESYCNYCLNWHCFNHRLPEKHKCIGKPKNPYKLEGVESYSRRGGSRYYAE